MTGPRITDQSSTGGVCSDQTPMPGGSWKVPADGRPMDHVKDVIAEMGIAKEDQAAYLQELVRQNGPPQPNRVLTLPPLQCSAETTSEPIDVMEDAGGPQCIDPEASGSGPTVERREGGGVSIRATQGTVRRGPPASVTTPVASDIDVPAEAQRLATAVRANDQRAIRDILHGRTKSEQQNIIRTFNSLPVARDTEVPVVRGSNFTPSGLLLNAAQKAVGATRTQQNDFQSRLERMDERDRAHIDALLKNPSSQLELHDKLYFCMKGWGTYEGGLRILTAEIRDSGQASEVKRNYFARYRGFRGTLENAIKEETSGIDRAEALMNLRGQEANSRWHRLAFDLYRHGDGKTGTDEEPIFEVLEREVLSDPTGQNFAHLERASKDLFGEDYDLHGQLNDDLRGGTPWLLRDMWTRRLAAATRRDNQSVKSAKTDYIVQTAELYLRGQVDWDGMSRVLDQIDPTGQNGPTLTEVEAVFKVTAGSDPYVGGDMTDRLGMVGGSEVREQLAILERANAAVIRQEDATTVAQRAAAEELAVKFYGYTVGDGWGTKEREGCDVLASITDPAMRREVDAAFQRLYDGMTVEQAIRSDYGDSPEWMDRALDHWQHGPLPAENMVYHVSRGAGEESEAVRAIRGLPSAERAAALQRYEAAHGTGTTLTARGVQSRGGDTLGTSASYDQLIEQMESRFHHWGGRGKGLNSDEAKVDNIALARSFGAQLRAQILDNGGPDALRRAIADDTLDQQIRGMLESANVRDRADNTIRDDNLDRTAAEIGAQIRGDFAAFQPSFELALMKMGDRTQRSVRSALAVSQLGNQGLGALRGAVDRNLERERGGGGWNEVSTRLMDHFGWSGEFVDNAARDFFVTVDRAASDGELTQGELQAILDRYGEFHKFVEEYQKEKDDVGETAGDIAAAAAAVVVSVASGGTATPLVVTIGAASAGAAKVGTEAAFKGQDYQLGSEEFWKDLVVGGVDGAVTVYTAGMSKAANGARFGRAVLIEANAAGLGSAASMGTRTALDEQTWDDGVLSGSGNVLKSVGMGYGTGFAIGGGFSALIRGGMAGWSALSRSQLDDQAAAQLGKGNTRVVTAGDLHSAGGDTAKILDDIPAGQKVMINGDLMSKMDEGMVQIGDDAGWRNVMTHVRKLADKADVQVTVGNHEEVFFAALDNPALYDDPARASLSRDFALRRLLGKPSTNFAKSMLQPYGVRGTAEMGRALRRELARDLRAAFGAGRREMSEASMQRLTTLAGALEDVNTPIPRSVLKGFAEIEGDLADLLQHGKLHSAIVQTVPAEFGPNAASRRYITVLQSTLTAADDAEAAAKYMFLEFADVGGDMTRARTALTDAARRLHVNPTTLAGQMDGMASFADDAAWLRGKLTGIQIDPDSGMLMVHGGWPYEIGPDGQTILRPDKVLEYQRAIQQGRFLGVADPEAYHLNPSWAGESVTLDPVTGNGRKVAELQDFSFVRPDVTAQSYDDAFAAFNRALKQDPDMMRALGLNPDTFDGVGFMLSGHENVRNDWVRRRASALAAKYGLSTEDARAAAMQDVRRMDPRDLMADQMDQLQGRHWRGDFGGEDGNFGYREAGGRHVVRPDGTIRTERVATSVDGLKYGSGGSASRELFENQAIRLTPEGAIELTGPARRREALALRTLLRQQGVPDDDVARVLNAIAPGASPDEAMERFVTEFYRTVGKNEGAVLDALAGGLGVSPDKVALELAKPVDGFRILAGQQKIRGDYATQFLMGRSMRTAAMGMVDVRPSTIGFDGLVQKANQMVARYPGSTVTGQGANWVEVVLNVNGVKSAVRLTGEAQAQYILVASVPLLREASQQ